MATINFQEFSVPVRIGSNRRRTGDARESVADLIYQNVGGIKAYALALKIYRSEGATEYGEDEVRIIEDVFDRWALPSFIDGLKEQLKEKGE